ncbi:hypothetical protein Y886_03975 [Xanthomonas hyacinthi DSM 19077]|nr:hypothetical protein Y886_03975 [Xanthomonas hyacinthi DSM 19077]
MNLAHLQTFIEQFDNQTAFRYQLFRNSVSTLCLASAHTAMKTSAQRLFVLLERFGDHRITGRFRCNFQQENGMEFIE